MSGKKICVYIKDDVEKDVIKDALAQYRATRKMVVSNPVLTPEQKKMLDILYKEFDEIKKRLRPVDTPEETPIDNNSIDFSNDFGVIN